MPRDPYGEEYSIPAGLTDAQLRATAVPVSLASVPSHGVTGPLTDSELRATAVAVSGALTDAQLRAAAVPVSLASVPSHAVTGPLTDTELRATAVPVSGPLTDTQLRATVVPVSGPVTDAQLRATAVPVSLASVPTHGVTGPLTDAELRASVVPVDATPAAPSATDYLPIRLTDGSAFYVAGSSSDAAGFTAHFDSIAPAANKHMATIFNTSATRKVVIHRICVVIEAFAAVTGAFSNQSLMFITARTAGTSVTPRANDSDDALSAGITADTGSTSVTDGHEKFGWLVASEEVTTACTNLQLGGNRIGRVIYEKLPGVKAIAIRQNQGISIKHITSTTVASFSYLIEFTDEPA